MVPIILENPHLGRVVMIRGWEPLLLGGEHYKGSLRLSLGVEVQIRAKPFVRSKDNHPKPSP